MAAHPTVHRAAGLALATDTPLGAAVLLIGGPPRSGTADRLGAITAVPIDIQRVGTAAPDPGRPPRIVQSRLVRLAAGVATRGFAVAAGACRGAPATGARRLTRTALVLA